MLIRFLASAEADIAGAIDWYLQHNVRAAERFADEVDDAVQMILETPDRFPIWDDRHRFLILRKFPYYVGYRIEMDHVLIVAVRHTAREADWTTRS